MIQYSFGRAVKVRVYATVLTEVGTSTNEVPEIVYNKGYTEFSSVSDDGLPGFRISGKVVKAQGTQIFVTNNLHVSIYNLSATSRAIVGNGVGTLMEVYAGYGNQVNLIGKGNIIRAKTYKQGPDYITELTCGDAHYASVNGTINKSFKGYVTYQQIFDACMSTITGYDIEAGVINIPANGAFNNGYVLHGSSIKEIQKLCKTMNRKMIIENHLLHILAMDEDLGNSTINISTLIDPITGEDLNTGLIGIPEINPPGSQGIQEAINPTSPQLNISFAHLLSSTFVVGQKVSINSKFVKGDYILGHIEHDFDSWDGPFFTNCQAVLAGKPFSASLGF
jgi:hypothetical protein